MDPKKVERVLASGQDLNAILIDSALAAAVRSSTCQVVELLIQGNATIDFFPLDRRLHFSMHLQTQMFWVVIIAHLAIMPLINETQTLSMRFWNLEQTLCSKTKMGTHSLLCPALLPRLAFA